MHTVRGGKSTRRWAFDQGGGQEPQAEQDPQRAAELQQGTMDALQKLRESLEGEQLDLLDSILSAILPPGTYDALSGVTGPVGRPTPPTVDNGAPPAFRGVLRTGGRDAPYRAMATDQRPRGTGPGGAIMAYDTAAIDDVSPARSCAAGGSDYGVA